jgi:predicted acetyltransferase
MLMWLKKNVLTDNIIITCEGDNIASEPVIKRCGGKYNNQTFSPEKNGLVKRFQLDPDT